MMRKFMEIFFLYETLSSSDRLDAPSLYLSFCLRLSSFRSSSPCRSLSLSLSLSLVFPPGDVFHTRLLLLLQKDHLLLLLFISFYFHFHFFSFSFSFSFSSPPS